MNIWEKPEKDKVSVLIEWLPLVAQSTTGLSGFANTVRSISETDGTDVLLQMLRQAFLSGTNDYDTALKDALAGRRTPRVRGRSQP